MPDGAPNPVPPVAMLHGRRKGKKLRSFQAGLVDQLLPRLSVDLAQASTNPAALFETAPGEVWLEIGFGGGEHLVARARSHPNIGFIGAEPFVNGVAKLLAEIDSTGIANIRIHSNDASMVVDALPTGSIAGIYLLYPDPWPKRRQRKRRFVSDDMLARLARVLKSGAALRFATDIDDYAGWVLRRVLASAQFRWEATSASDWLEPWDEWPGTRYEAKAILAGRKPVYLTFLRN